MQETHLGSLLKPTADRPQHLWIQRECRDEGARHVGKVYHRRVIHGQLVFRRRSLGVLVLHPPEVQGFRLQRVERRWRGRGGHAVYSYVVKHSAWEAWVVDGDERAGRERERTRADLGEQKRECLLHRTGATTSPASQEREMRSRKSIHLLLPHRPIPPQHDPDTQPNSAEFRFPVHSSLRKCGFPVYLWDREPIWNSVAAVGVSRSLMSRSIKVQRVHSSTSTHTHLRPWITGTPSSSIIGEIEE